MATRLTDIHLPMTFLLLAGACSAFPQEEEVVVVEESRKAATSLGAGNGIDYMSVVSGTIRQAEGSFPRTSGVASVVDSQEPGFQNRYTLQINTQIIRNHPLCLRSPDPNCEVWVQFVYSVGGIGPKQATLEIWYWLFSYRAPGSDTCPQPFKRWQDVGCLYWPITMVPGQPIAQADQIKLTARVGKDYDELDLALGNNIYNLTVSSPIDLYQHWKEAEFNVFGRGNYSHSSFNPGTSLLVQLITDSAMPTTSAPYCKFGGMTGESNNLSLSSTCCPLGGDYPGIQFAESNDSPPKLSCPVPVTPVGQDVPAGFFYMPYYTGGAIPGIGLRPGAYTASQLAALGLETNTVSSVRIPKGYMAILYDGDQFTGPSVTLTADTPDLASAPIPFDNRMSSVVILPARIISVMPDQSQALNLFRQEADGTIMTIKQKAPNSDWGSWLTLGGNVTGNLAVGRNQDGTLELFGRNANGGGIWHTSQVAPNGIWRAWEPMGGSNSFEGRIAVGVNKDGRLELFAKGQRDNYLWHNWQLSPNSSLWSGWYSLGGTIDGNLTVVNNVDGNLEVFSGGGNSEVWHLWQDPTISGWWSNWQNLGGRVNSNLAVGRNAGGVLQLFAARREGENDIYYRYQTSSPRTNTWSTWTKLDCDASGYNVSVALSGAGSTANDLVLFHRSNGLGSTPWRIWAMRQTSPNSYSAWAGWYRLPTEGGPVGSDFVVGKNQAGYLEVFAQNARNNGIVHSWQNSATGAWSAWLAL